MPPPKKKLPPPKAPAGKYVFAKLLFGKYTIVTLTTGMVVGSRLDKGKGKIPTGYIGLETPAEAMRAVKDWDKFIEDNTAKI